LKSFTDKFSLSLGPRAEEIIAEDSNTIQKHRQRLEEVEIQQRDAENAAAEKEKLEQEAQNLQEKIERESEKLKNFEDEHGSILENQTEIQRLKVLIKNYKEDLQKLEKQIAELDKIVKNKEKFQIEADTLRQNIAKYKREKNIKEERLNSTKTIDELKEKKSELKSEKERNEAIIQDENTAPSEKRAARARLAEINEENPRLQTQIAEREDAMPL